MLIVKTSYDKCRGYVNTCGS